MLASIFRYFAVESFASVILNAWCAEREKKNESRNWFIGPCLIVIRYDSWKVDRQQQQKAPTKPVNKHMPQTVLQLIDDHFDVRLLSV